MDPELEVQDAPGQTGMEPTEKPEPDAEDKALVKRLLDRIAADRKHHEKAFKQMRRDMKIARNGREDAWGENRYTANITGRNINQKVSALYAKNPKAVARRRERLDFTVWDEDPQTLMMALQQVQKATAAPPQVDPATGAMVPPAVDPQALAIVQDFQKGMLRRTQIERVGKTLEILFNYFTQEQTPVDFKTSMKQMVRRTATTGVGYVKIGFQRQMDEDPAVTQRLADFQAQIRQLEHMAGDVQEGEDDSDDAGQARELQYAMQSLQKQQYVLVREGLVFDFPSSTSVIPDKATKNLVGFVGARWITVQYFFTPEEVERDYKVDLKQGCTKYADDGTLRSGDGQYNADQEGAELVCVLEHFDRQTGVVYLLCDGYQGFLRPPQPPEVYVESFWPVEALTFNEVEDESCLFPPSDVTLMLDMQRDYNRARQGKREHRKAARPRYVAPKGVLDDEDKAALSAAEAFSVTELNNWSADTPIDQVLQPVPMEGVDPNLYDTGEIMTDIQLTVGAQESAFGATGGATATESSLAEGSRVASVDSNVDDLDGFLTRVARASGQVLLREMSPQSVMEIAGEGAMWPQLTLDQIAKEIYLEIEAGSSGKPNQAQEIRNWKEMLPFLLQMPGINPVWLARESLRRLDDRMDLTEALVSGLPAIVAMNRGGGGQMGEDPGNAPDQQGEQGANNGPAPPGGPTGSDAPMGNNQQAIM